VSNGHDGIRLKTPAYLRYLVRVAWQEKFLTVQSPTAQTCLCDAHKNPGGELMLNHNMIETGNKATGNHQEVNISRFLKVTAKEEAAATCISGHNRRNQNNFHAVSRSFFFWRCLEKMDYHWMNVGAETTRPVHLL
jgi:hypothetical protein